MIQEQQMPRAQAFDTAIELLPSANRSTRDWESLRAVAPAGDTAQVSAAPTARGILFA